MYYLYQIPSFNRLATETFQRCGAFTSDFTLKTVLDSDCTKKAEKSVKMFASPLQPFRQESNSMILEEYHDLIHQVINNQRCLKTSPNYTGS